MVLVDSNVLLRVLQRDHPMHKEAWGAVRALHQKKELVLAPQNIVSAILHPKAPPSDLALPR
jgi:hypothetical protein